MPSPRLMPLRAGRTLALLGILLVALNLRTAVASVSPIAAEIGRDIHLDSLALGVIGTLPPIVFAASGLISPGLGRRLGLEASLALACAVIAAGYLVRSFATGFPQFLIGSAVALLAAGVGNVLLPPVVKRYFPDRVGLLTSLYVSLLAVGAMVPPMVAAPVAQDAGWRASLGVWSVLAVIAVVPWGMMWLRHRRSLGAPAGVADELAEVVTAPRQVIGRLRHSRIVWALTMAQAVSSMNAYTMFTWLPALLVGVAGVSATEAGAMLSLFAFLGLPLGLIVPVVAQRINAGWLIQVGTVALVVGYLGFLLAPAAAPWLWVSAAGIGPILFPALMLLINSRTRDHVVTTAVSGFVQGNGYLVGAIGPFLFGLLHSATGSWTAPLLLMLLSSAVSLVSGLMLASPAMVEDELAGVRTAARRGGRARRHR